MNKAKTKPLVSIILPVYKSEAYLEACLNSLSNQSYSNIEIIAVVDYLGDNSLKILKKHKKIDKRLRIYENIQRYGLASTLNRAVGLAKGQYIAFMDSAGIAEKTRINKQVKFLVDNPKIAAVGSQIVNINELGKKMTYSMFPTQHEEIYKHLIAGESFKFESSLIDKTRLPKDILKFKKGTHYPYVYIDVFMKIGVYSELANINETLTKTRIIQKTKKTINIDKTITFIKLLFDGTTNYEYKPSVKALFSPILRQN